MKQESEYEVGDLVIHVHSSILGIMIEITHDPYYPYEILWQPYKEANAHSAHYIKKATQ